MDEPESLAGLSLAPSEALDNIVFIVMADAYLDLAVRDIDFGDVYVNRIGPESTQGFHVGYRQSGVGGDDGLHGVELNLKSKTVDLNYSDGPTARLMPYSGR